MNPRARLRARAMLRVISVALGLSCLACSAESGRARGGPAQHTRDSAGVQIVENDQPVVGAADAPRLAATPTLVIGDRPGPDYVLSAVVGAARLIDRRIVVADRATQEIRFFDSTGMFLNSVGGRGEGPGEFRRLDALGTLPGDTIFGLSLPGAVTFFDHRGAFLRRVDASRLRVGLPEGPKIVVAVLGDQSLVVGPIPRPSLERRPTRWVDSLPLVMLRRDTTKWVLLGTFPFMFMTRDGNTPRPPWFGPTAAFAAHDASFFAGYGGEYSIRVFSISGGLERIIRRRWTPTRVTSADIDQFVTDWAKRWIKATGPEAEQQKRDLRDDPYAGEVPAYSQLLVDHAGRLWVREAHLADASAAGQLTTIPLVPSLWSVFDEGGHWLGDVTMPARFMPTDIGRNYVLGIARDSDGVETVVEYAYAANAGAQEEGR
jgi:hypothetical protein